MVSGWPSPEAFSPLDWSRSTGPQPFEAHVNCKSLTYCVPDGAGGGTCTARGSASVRSRPAWRNAAWAVSTVYDCAVLCCGVTCQRTETVCPEWTDAKVVAPSGTAVQPVGRSRPSRTAVVVEAPPETVNEVVTGAAAPAGRYASACTVREAVLGAIMDANVQPGAGTSATGTPPACAPMSMSCGL